MTKLPKSEEIISRILCKEPQCHVFVAHGNMGMSLCLLVEKLGDLLETEAAARMSGMWS